MISHLPARSLRFHTKVPLWLVFGDFRAIDLFGLFLGFGATTVPIYAASWRCVFLWTPADKAEKNAPGRPRELSYVTVDSLWVILLYPT